ncbi:PREDICTED: uncharacterized protein LOC104803241 isoform X2 [Tarenaya hassleriana]|uniref:uncharacterized protein LOC104803241 isoform X2 n=1 Tax=Tarenaya hassleriana TaxID=28532 RepID=UPI00053C51DA|nr:PREDICTED: uncharacterized protein LOC104803241 isoform X2 [Tarenaya hassleriana]
MSDNSSITLSDSHNNPFYLGSNDQTNLVLVSKILTDHSDFSSWHRSMSMALEGRNKLGFVDGTIVKPADSDPNAVLWSRNNTMVSSWILHSVSADIASRLLYVKTAKGMWDKILKCFEQTSAPRRFSIKRRMNALRQGSLSVATFYNRLVALWEEKKAIQSSPYCKCGKCTCGVDQRWNEYNEEDLVMDFLFGLNDSFESVREQILLIEPLPDLEKTYHLVSQQEHQRSIRLSSLSDNPILHTSDSATNISDSVAAVSGYHQKQKQKPLCTHCGMYGHTVNKCYKLHGYPPGYKFNSKTSEPKQQFATSKVVNSAKGPVANVQNVTVVYDAWRTLECDHCGTEDYQCWSS